MAGRRSFYCEGAGARGGVSDASRLSLHNQRALPLEPFDSLFLSDSSPSFLGSRSMVSFEDFSVGNRSERSFFHSYNDEEANGDDEMDEYLLYQPEKKRRLSADQVRSLEKSFEVDNRLEPERKVQLAKELSLQPRQVAIWFQNRRARWKTKQLEKDYDLLQSSYEGLKANYDTLLKEKEKLKAQVLHLKDKLILQEKENGSSQSSETNQPCEGAQRRPIADSNSEVEVSKVSYADRKQEEYLSSEKSDLMDSGSPHSIDKAHSLFIEAGDSSYGFERHRYDQSHNEKDSSEKDVIRHPTAYVFPKIEDGGYADPPVNSSYFTFPIEDQNFGFWSY